MVTREDFKPGVNTLQCYYLHKEGQRYAYDWTTKSCVTVNPNDEYDPDDTLELIRDESTVCLVSDFKMIHSVTEPDGIFNLPAWVRPAQMETVRWDT